MRRFLPLLSLLLVLLLLPALTVAQDIALTGCTLDNDYALFTLALDQPTSGTLYATVGGPELPPGDFDAAGEYTFRLYFDGDLVTVLYVLPDGTGYEATVRRGSNVCQPAREVTGDAPTIELTVPGPGWYQWGGWDAFGTPFDTGIITQAEPTDDGAGWRVRLTLGEQGSRDAADWFVTAVSP